MTAATDSEVLHVQAEPHLPAVPMAAPAVEMLKQILEQMLENERRRVRNEFFRLGFVFLVFLLAILGGGFWLAHDILRQMRAERELSEKSWNALVGRLGPRGGAAAQAAPGAASEPALPETGSAEEIHRLIADLEDKNRELTELVKTQSAGARTLMRDVLREREAALQGLYARMGARHDQALAAMAEAEPPEPELPQSLIVPINNEVSLRAPLPVP